MMILHKDNVQSGDTVHWIRGDDRYSATVLKIQNDDVLIGTNTLEAYGLEPAIITTAYVKYSEMTYRFRACLGDVIESVEALAAI